MKDKATGYAYIDWACIKSLLKYKNMQCVKYTELGC